ncbi:TcfC E-set like domain-containing protein, partial [Vibrio parahaemolyticus]|nr:TcfC E-set like domain-containing protein [Vibrio parahaemolyticus]
MRQLLFLLLYLPYVCHAKYIPDDFKFLYEEQSLTISVLLPNDLELDFDVIANYDGVIRFEDDHAFEVALANSGVKLDKINAIVDKVTNDCNTSLCEDVDVSFDYDSMSLSVKVPANFLSEQFAEQPYTNITPNTNGIISKNDVNVSYSGDNLRSTFNNDTTIGLGRGFIDTGVKLNTRADGGTEVSLEKMYYYHNFPGYRLNFGYYEYSSSDINDNASGMLDYTNPDERLFVSFGTSTNLLKQNKEQYSRIYFDMPSKGLVQFVRDGRVIKSVYYRQGQNYILLSDLPRGNYDLTIVITPENGNQETITRRINSRKSNFSLDGQDFNIALNNIQLSDEFDESELSFIEASYAKLLENGLTFGGISRVSDDGDIELGLYTGLQYQNVESSVYVSTSDSGEFFNYSFGFDRLALDYQELNSTKDYGYMAALYGDRSFRQWSGSYGFQLLDGSFSLYVNDSIRDYEDRDFRSLSSGISYSRYIFGRTSLSLNFSHNINTDVDQLGLESTYSENVFGINLQIPLSDELDYSSNYQYSDSPNSTLTNTLHDNSLYHDETILVGGSVSSTVNGSNSIYGVSANYRQNERKYKSDGYFSYDMNQEKLANLNASTTIVSDWNDVYFVSDDSSSSYMIITNSNDDSDDKAEQSGQVLVKTSSGASSRPV